MKYSYQKNKDSIAKAYGRDLNISTKYSVLLCKSIRGKSVKKAIDILENIISGKKPLAMTRYNKDTAHKAEIGPGKYPVKAASVILRMVKSAQSNAQNIGLSTNDLVIDHIVSHKASRPWHFGRQRRRKMKRSHIEICLKELKK